MIDLLLATAVAGIPETPTPPPPLPTATPKRTRAPATDETRAKLSAAAKARFADPVKRAAITAAIAAARLPTSDETKAKLSASMTEAYKDPALRAKVSIAQKVRWAKVKPTTELAAPTQARICRSRKLAFTDEQWKHYIQAYSRVDENGCWIWQLAIMQRHRSNPAGGGYGMFSYYDPDKRKSRMRTVHRFAYELWVGPIPEGREVAHHVAICKSRACCNPEHLYAATHSQNTSERDPAFLKRSRVGYKTLNNGLITRAFAPGQTVPADFIYVGRIKKSKGTTNEQV